MDNFYLSCQVMADMGNFYNDLIIINLYDKNSPFIQFCDKLKVENVPLWNEEENLSSSCLIGIQGTPLAYCCSMSRLPGRGIRCSHVTVYVTNNLGITGNKIFIPLLAINSSLPNILLLLDMYCKFFNNIAIQKIPTFHVINAFTSTALV